MAGLNYDDIKKKLGIKVIPNQTPIVKVVEEEKLVEPKIEKQTSYNPNEIKIGVQTWSSKNLEVTKYRNDDAIPQVQDKNAWANLRAGAWCYYENDATNGTTYGKLYNWYAVNDPRGLAPKGYHIPTDAEWTILTDNLGDEAGTKMKSSSDWDDDGHGTNTTGFTGLPGGCRLDNGDFKHIGAYAIWWTSSEHSASSAWYRYFYSIVSNVDRNGSDKRVGFSVRCLAKTNTVIPKESDTIAEDERKYYEFQTNKSLPETPFENKNNSSSIKEEIIEFKTEAERKFKQDLLLFERKFKQEFPLLMKLLIKIKNYIIKLMKI